MALKLIRSGPVTRQGVVPLGTGWVTITGYDPARMNHPYWEGRGLTQVTVTAWGCDGIQVHHWGGDGYVQSPTAGKNHTVGAILDLTSNNAVIRVLNPTDKTKVIVNMQPLSLSRKCINRICEAVRAWL